MGDPNSTKNNIRQPVSIMNDDTRSNQTPSPDHSHTSTVHTKANDDARSASPSLRTGDDPSDESLPRGWEVSISKEGKKYYIDHNTRTTTWDRPSDDYTPPHPDSDAMDSELPAGWEQRETTDGQTYLVDHNTKTTSWFRPQRDVHEPSGFLPVRWERRHTKAGRPYFLDHNARTTTWTPPWQTEAQEDAQTQLPGLGEDTEARPAMNTDSTTTATMEGKGWKVVSKL